MEKKEFAVFAAAMRTYYSKENLLPNQQAMELWYRELQDIPYNVAEAGLRKWVATNKWSPTIADIREMTSDVSQGEIADWGEGWEKVLRVVRRYGSYREAEAMNELTGITKTVVQRLGYRNICVSENIPADRANFRDMYNAMAERQKKDMQLSPQLRQVIGLLGGSNESNRLLEENKAD